MTEQTPCLICNNADAKIGTSPGLNTNEHAYSCPKCKKYICNFEDVCDGNPSRQDISASPEKTKTALSYRVYHHNKKNNRPLKITYDVIKSLLPISPFQQAENYITYLGNEQPSPGEGITVNGNEIEQKLCSEIGVSVSNPIVNLRYILENLEKEELIKRENINQRIICKLTFKGWQKFEELKQTTLDKKTAFMAMAFRPKDDKPEKLKTYNEFMIVYPRFQTKLLELGYNLENPLETTPKEGRIDARLEAEIRKCRFLVADLSLENEGAYWEAGFAHGLGKPVFYVCKEGVRQHFDTSHHTTIFWNPGKEDEDAERLRDTIFNTIGNA